MSICVSTMVGQSTKKINKSKIETEISNLTNFSQSPKNLKIVRFKRSFISCDLEREEVLFEC